MAFGLKKDGLRKRDEHVEALRKAKSTLDDAMEVMRNEIAFAMEKANSAIRAYNETLTSAREWVEEVHGELQDAYDEKSERWQEGDAGSAAQDLISAWEGLEMDDLDELEIIEPECGDADHADDLEGVDTEANT